MNILFAYNGYIDPIDGGIQRVTHVLANFFSEKGHRVFFISFSKPNNDFFDERQFYLPNSKEVDHGDNINFLKDFIAINNIDILINQSGMSHNFSSLLYNVKRRGTVFISCIHNSLLASVNNFSTTYYALAKKYRLSKFLFLTDNSLIKSLILFIYKLKYRKHYKRLVHNSDKIVLLSNYFFDELHFFVNKIEASKVIAISNPLSFEVKETFTNLIANKKKELLYVGRIDIRQKRVDLLLDVWSLLYKVNKDWSLNIVGGGPDLNELQGYVKDKGLERVKFFGFLDPKKFYNSARIFCMTSPSEGFGIVLIEAMQYAVIPVAFNSYKSILDIIDNNINGVLIKPFEVETYAEQIQLLIDNNDRMLAKKAFEKSELFSVNNIGEKWLSLFYSLKAINQ